MSDYEPATTFSRRKRHLVASGTWRPALHEDGQTAATLCREGGYDQGWVDAQCARWRDDHFVVADLPLCKRCERIAGGAQ